MLHEKYNYCGLKQLHMHAGGRWQMVMVKMFEGQWRLHFRDLSIVCVRLHMRVTTLDTMQQSARANLVAYSLTNYLLHSGKQRVSIKLILSLKENLSSNILCCSYSLIKSCFSLLS